VHPAKDLHPDRATRAERPQSAKCQHYNGLQPLCPLFAAFSTPRLFSTACSLFCKNTRGVGVSRSDWCTLGGSRRRLPMPEMVLPDTRVEFPSATPPRPLRLSGIICSGLDRLNALIPLPLITSLQPLHFHALTHSFAQWRPVKPCPLKRLRTLSITTGEYARAAEDSTSTSSGGQRCYLQ
jgi:hypothetical protein